MNASTKFEIYDYLMKYNESIYRVWSQSDEIKWMHLYAKFEVDLINFFMEIHHNQKCE